MARGNSPGSSRARSAIGARDAELRAALEAPPVAAVSPQDPVDSAIHTLFRTDERVRDAVTTRLSERSSAAEALTGKAEDAFSGFTASRRSADDRKLPQYLGPNDDLDAAHKNVIEAGAAAIGKSDISRSVTLRPGKDLKALIDKNGGNGDSLAGTIKLKDLWSYLSSQPSPSLAATPEFTTCKAEWEANKRLEEVKTKPKKKGEANHDGSDSNGDGGHPTGKAAEFVRANVTRQMESATSPEAKLSYAVQDRADPEELQTGIQTFELRSGPSDVTSYHDFSTLQIAFQSVWTEVFDGRLTALGQELYQECVKLREFTGLDTDRDPVSTIDDLRNLMDEVKSLSQFTQEEIPWQPRSPGSGDGVSVSSTSAVDYTKALLDPASVLTDAIGDKTVAAIVDPLGAAIDVVSALLSGKKQLTWDSFPGPLPDLPEGYNYITPTFEDDAVNDGEVEIVLKDSRGASSPWKGLGLYEFDASGNLLNTWKISNWKDDNDVWDKAHYDTLPLYTPQIQYGLIEFDTESYFGLHHGFFLLGDLDQKIKNRTRVTFTW